jgi:hypothetical protein
MLNGDPVHSVEPMDRLVQRFSISHGVNLILGNLVFRQPLVGSHPGRMPRLLLVLRLGAGTTRPHAESTIEGHAHEHYHSAAPRPSSLQGLSCTLSIAFTGQVNTSLPARDNR